MSLSNLNNNNIVTQTTSVLATAAAAANHNHADRNIFNNNNKRDIESIDELSVSGDFSDSGGGCGGGGGAGGVASDEDVLHVVTNVYTIPILKSSVSVGCSVNDQPISECDLLQQKTKCNPDVYYENFPNSANKNNNNVSSSYNYSYSTKKYDHPMHVETNYTTNKQQTRQEKHKQFKRHEFTDTNSVSSSTSSPIISPQSMCIVSAAHVKQQTPNNCTQSILSPSTSMPCDLITAAPLKPSKFQIRSIVEIYENDEQQQQQQQQKQDVGTFKSSSRFEEITTKEVFKDTTKPQKKGDEPRLDKNVIFISLSHKKIIYSSVVIAFKINIFRIAFPLSCKQFQNICISFIIFLPFIFLFVKFLLTY